MDKPQVSEIPRSKRAAQRLRSTEAMPIRHEGSTGLSMAGWTKRYRQLDWGDRLNLVLAAILGLALILVLSPLLILSWICLQFAKRGIGFKRRRPEN